ncbi:MAG: non-heme iron oxygenase ferredoxin subunit [Candidatus Solibacter usitatus]|nr:non-heme iron oxygenase ferredoxin subunit [Candidatus Solibacter usitatus]
MATYIRVARASELPSGQGKLVEAGGKKIALFNIEGTFYALDDTCTHRGGPLSEGALEGNEVTCPWHGAVFDVTTGNVLGAPAPRGVASYPVRVQGDDIEVEI